MNTILHMFLAAAATMGFSIIFNVPKRELIFCGISGAAGWTVYTLITTFWAYSTIPATLFAAMTVTTLARFLSGLRKMPSTIYMIPGIIPLVPGIGIYFTMFHIINGDNAAAVVQGVDALKIAGVIAIGLLIILSLPRKLFFLNRR